MAFETRFGPTRSNRRQKPSATGDKALEPPCELRGLHLQYWRLLILPFFSLDDSASVLRLAERSGQYHFRHIGTCSSSFPPLPPHLPYIMYPALILLIEIYFRNTKYICTFTTKTVRERLNRISASQRFVKDDTIFHFSPATQRFTPVRASLLFATIHLSQALMHNNVNIGRILDGWPLTRSSHAPLFIICKEDT